MKKWIKSTISLLLMLTMVFSILPVGVFAAESVDIDQTAQYRLINKATGKMLIRTDDNTYVAGRTDVYKVAATTYDAENDFGKWTFRDSTNSFQLLNVGSGGIAGLHKTLESYEGITNALHVITVDNQSTKTGMQRMVIEDAGDGYIRIRNDYNQNTNGWDVTRYLSVTGDSFGGSDDAVYACMTVESNTDNQLWKLEKVGEEPAEPVEIDPQAHYRLVNKADGRMLIRTDDNTYVAGRSDVYKVAATAYDADNDFGKWTFASVGSNKFQIRNVGSGVAGLHKTNEAYGSVGNHVVTVDSLSSGTPQQRFTLVDMGNGYVQLYNDYEESSKTYIEPQYLAVTSDSFGGSADTVYACLTNESNTDKQLWKLEQVEGTGTQPLPELDEFQPLPLFTKDTLTMVKPGSVDIDGFVNEAILHAQNDELKVWDWEKLVEQFRNKTDTDNKWRGEFWGKQMRGAAFTYAYTQDEELYAIMEASVRDLLSTQDPFTGRISSYPNDWGLWDVWCRKYVMLGMEAFYSICKDEALKDEILTAMCYHADYIIDRLGPAADGKTEIVQTGYWNGIASSSILEPIMMLYNLTGFQRYLDFASYIVSTGCTKDPNVNIFELAYEGKVMPSRWYKNQTKAYEMTSCFEGLAEYYRVTGEEKWKTACLNYYRLVTENEITIAGSGGGAARGAGYSYYNPGQVEHWNNLGVNQSDFTLKQTQETCITVTWMKYCFQMLRLVGDSEVADDLEISIYNALLAAMNAEGVHVSNYEFVFDYFTALNGQKPNPFGGALYDSEGPIGSCCSANGHSGIGLIPFIGVMNRADGPVINLYHDSTVHANGATLDITGSYPFEDTVNITVTPETEGEFTVSLRIPAWSAKTTVAVNGTEQTGIVAGEYYAITRDWTAGDVITLKLDLRTRVVADRAGFDKIALMRGPIVLARDSRFAQGEVSAIQQVVADENGYVEAVAAEPVFNSHLTLSVPCADGSSVLFCDYASAGQTWTGASRYAVWMQEAGVLPIVENTPFYLYCSNTMAAVTIKSGNATVHKNTLPAEGEVVADRIWVFEKSGNYWLIKNPATDLYITVIGTGNGAQLELKPYIGDGSQQWSIAMNGKDTFIMTSVQGGALFSEVGNEGDGTGLHLWEDVTNPVQWYAVVPVADPDAEAAAAVDALIEAIGEVTLEKEAAIAEARAAYEALNDNAKTLVTKLETLEAAEAAYAALAEAEADKKAAAAVDALIEAIGEVTMEKETAITEARAAYEALNDNAKSFVTKLAVLEAAEQALAAIIRDVTVELSVADEVNAYDGDLTYTVSAKDMVDLATVILCVDLDETLLTDPVAKAAEGWNMIAQNWVDGELYVALANMTGADGEGVILTVTATPTGVAGTASAVLTEVTLCAYQGEGETFVNAVVDQTPVTTVINTYSVFDVNRDGIVDQLDMTRAQRYFGLTPEDADWYEYADVDGSDSVDIEDLILILNNYHELFE